MIGIVLSLEQCLEAALCLKFVKLTLFKNKIQKLEKHSVERIPPPRLLISQIVTQLGDRLFDVASSWIWNKLPTTNY